MTLSLQFVGCGDAFECFQSEHGVEPAAALGLRRGFALFAIAWSIISMAHSLANSWLALFGLRGWDPIAHGALILLGGFLLILPGFFTDVLGLMLMIPLVRRGLIAALGPRIQVQGFAASRFRRDPAEDWVDAEYEEVVPDRDKIGGPSKWSRH